MIHAVGRYAGRTLYSLLGMVLYILVMPSAIRGWTFFIWFHIIILFISSFSWETVSLKLHSVHISTILLFILENYLNGFFNFDQGSVSILRADDFWVNTFRTRFFLGMRFFQFFFKYFFLVMKIRHLIFRHFCYEEIPSLILHVPYVIVASYS